MGFLENLIGKTFLSKSKLKTMKKENLNFSEAMSAIEAGYKVKLPEWTGYWYKGQNHVEVFTKTGDRLTTPDKSAYGHRNDWLITDGQLGFDFAILALKNGKLVRRSGWNGKGMFVFMRPADSLRVDFIIDKVKSLPQDLKDYFSYGIENLKNRIDDQVIIGDAIKPHNPEYLADDKIDFTAYLCMKVADGTIVNGWLASQTDMLAEDWELAE